MSKFYRDNDEEPLLPKTMGEAPSPHGEWHDGEDVPRGRRATRTRRQIIRRHVLRIFVLMSLVWLVHVFVRKGKRMANGRVSRLWHKNDKHIEVPPWIFIEECAELSPESGVPVEFDMPLDRAVLYSMGGLAKGSVVTRQSNSTSDFAPGAKKTAKVIVRPIFSDPAFLDYVQVCKIKQQYDSDESFASRGVGILTVPWSSQGFGHFEMEVILPASKEEPLEAGELGYETYEMENRIGYLPDTHFERIQAYADYRAPISAGYVSGRIVSFETDRYPIWGTFATESMIYLKAKKAPVSASVHLHDAQEKPDPKDPWVQPAVFASVKAVNARLDVNAHLTSANGSHGNFYVETHTALSDINLLFETAPVNSTLKVDADTSVGTARVLLHPTFDGSYTLEAPFMWRKMYMRDYEEGAKDPAGLGRARVVFHHDERPEVFEERGDIFWVAEGESGWEKRTESRVWVKSTAGGVGLGY